MAGVRGWERGQTRQCWRNELRWGVAAYCPQTGPSWPRRTRSGGGFRIRWLDVRDVCISASCLSHLLVAATQIFYIDVECVKPSNNLLLKPREPGPVVEHAMLSLGCVVFCFWATLGLFRAYSSF